MAQDVQLQDLRESSVWRRSGSNTEEEEKPSSNLLRWLWLLLIPLILLIIFGCGTLALIQVRPAQADTRSYMAADYQPWEYTVFKPLNPEIILEILRDRELFPETFDEPVQPIVVSGGFWEPTETPDPLLPTPTPSPTFTGSLSPTPAITGTSTPTRTATPTLLATGTSTITATASLTPSPTPTNTPSGPPPPIPPGSPPANTYWFYDDAFPMMHMMYTSIPFGGYQSGSSETFHSPTFTVGQSLQAGTTTANFYATNPSNSMAVFNMELRAGGNLLGTGSFALPANVFDAYFFSASISTLQYDFNTGDRLELSFSLAGSGRLYWDGAYNYSGIAAPAVVSSPTATPTTTSTASETPTPTDTPVPANTPTDTPVPPTNRPTNTATGTPTNTATSTPTNTPVPPTSTPTDTPTPTNTPTITPTPTPIPCLDTYPGGLNYGPPDGLFFAIGCNQSHIIDLVGDLPGGSAISRDSNPLTYDFVYYERAAVNGFFENGIYLDRVTIEVCVNSSCSGGPNSVVVVFNWGDGLPDNNANVGSLGLPETGNDWIDEGDLYNGTGIAIDVDAMVSGGPSSYQYLRVTAPGADFGLGAEIDSIADLP